ncbi:hypothetical protein RR46_06833 [Papilio xuthus]|uniref:Uncharacterized protein n=1 Tax=Papilio xuthus TaxID=66420 RepID=A0A194PTL8_PAPXU|nr:hypothetical protein RR46_06833 [Papilio xuthus]
MNKGLPWQSQPERDNEFNRFMAPTLLIVGRARALCVDDLLQNLRNLQYLEFSSHTTDLDDSIAVRRMCRRGRRQSISRQTRTAKSSCLPRIIRFANIRSCQGHYNTSLLDKSVSDMAHVRISNQYSGETGTP